MVCYAQRGVFYVKKSEHLDRRNHHRRLGDRVRLVPFNIGPSFSVTVGAPVMMLYCLRRGDPGFFASFLWVSLPHPDRDGLHFDALARVHRVLHRFRFHRFGRPVHAESPTSNRDQNQKALVWQVTLGTIVGTVGHYFWHTIAGYYFWGSYAPEEDGAHGSTPSS